jgi:transcriptional regulator with XRE-family HTH domain
VSQKASETAPGRLREARLKLYPSALAFAERLGVSYNTYMSHERGERGMDLDTVERYAVALRVTPGWLAFGEPVTGTLDLPAVLRAAADRLEAAERDVADALGKLTAARGALS